jgi:hypothetical protein
VGRSAPEDGYVDGRAPEEILDAKMAMPLRLATLASVDRPTLSPRHSYKSILGIVFEIQSYTCFHGVFKIIIISGLPV